jgi:hypothetical protein
MISIGNSLHKGPILWPLSKQQFYNYDALYHNYYAIPKSNVTLMHKTIILGNGIILSKYILITIGEEVLLHSLPVMILSTYAST